MTQLIRIRRKKQRSLCPYDDTIAQLKGGMQHAPKWLRSVRKYPPEKMWLTPGKVARPSEFWSDRVRGILLRNQQRPDWIPSLLNARKSPSTTFITNHAAFQEAFDVATYGSNPDVEFAAVQAWFMHKKNMSEQEAYTQARFRCRDLVHQKKRVWECYRRYKFLDQEQRNAESVSIVDGWMQKVKQSMKEDALKQFEKKQQIQNFKQSLESLKRPSSRASGEQATTAASDSDAVKSELGALRKQEWEFDRKWEENMQLMRFIEYTDYVAQNPHLGLSDPTEILLGIPNNNHKKNLLLKMAKRDRRKLKYISK
mmetsp:Transcript_23217/g.37186  ORF Transcript_23217/g.37186 Transcript_23217/m.37186 type:complete len:312 (+) Transcript_23217:1699-2634(+)